ncbi:MAG: hypothetical protein IPL01_14550 [Acidobacteria bacterium]|nr:hypothetical protein [Acidobacteriota bacterium]
MTGVRSHPQTILCIVSFYKGHDFIRECRSQGCRVVLMTREKLRNAEWPLECIDYLIVVPDKSEIEDYIFAANDFSLSNRIDIVVALEEGDVITAARIRAHLAIAGMTTSTARTFRDKLWMRIKAGGAGISQPRATLMLNYQDVGSSCNRSRPPG